MSKPERDQPETQKRREHREPFAAFTGMRSCPACGSIPHRQLAQFCGTCGRSLEIDAYVPADTCDRHITCSTVAPRLILV
jgi:hypothetical protein